MSLRVVGFRSVCDVSSDLLPLPGRYDIDSITHHDTSVYEVLWVEKRKKMNTFSSYCCPLTTVSRSATKWELFSSNWFPIPRSIICSEMVEVVYTDVRWDSRWVGHQKPTTNVLIEYWRLALHVLNLSDKARRFAIRCHRFKFTCSSMMSLVSVRRLNRNISTKMKESSLEWLTPYVWSCSKAVLRSPSTSLSRPRITRWTSYVSYAAYSASSADCSLLSCMCL